jgi:hypothetical protein
MNPKRRRWLAVIFLSLVVIGWAMGQYDYSRLVAGKRPLFARISLYCDDGGSVQYLGLGYTITDLHRMRWGMEMSPDVRVNASNEITPFLIGPTLDYWTPFVSRQQTRFVVETNK